MARIHPTSIVHPNARLAEDVEVGPFCTIGEKVEMGAGTRLISHVVVDGPLVMGRNNVVFPFASVGLIPQDLKFAGEETRLVIGDGNRIREAVTIHRGTAGGGGVTVVGHDNLFMATSHVAHDCHVGSRVVMANGTALAGHVTLGDGCILGGLVGIHQFVKVGRLAFIGAGAMVAQDVPPFMMAVGDRARLIGVNATGLERAGLDADHIRALKSVYKLLCLSDIKLAEALDKILADHGKTAEAREVVDFVRASERGICR